MSFLIDVNQVDEEILFDVNLDSDFLQFLDKNIGNNEDKIFLTKNMIIVKRFLNNFKFIFTSNVVYNLENSMRNIKDIIKLLINTINKYTNLDLSDNNILINSLHFHFINGLIFSFISILIILKTKNIIKKWILKS